MTKKYIIQREYYTDKWITLQGSDDFDTLEEAAKRVKWLQDDWRKSRYRIVRVRSSVVKTYEIMEDVR